MRVLVTGWAGYIGPVVVKHLKAAGHEVVGLDTGWFLPDYAEAPDWPHFVYFGDIRTAFPVSPHVDAVVHLAGLSNDPMGDLGPDLTKDINQAGTLLAFWDYPNAHHVVVSSCSVYGHNDEIATEATPVNPLTAYARTKAEVDYFLSDKAACLRLGTVWGYSPGHRLDLVVNRMMHDAVDRGHVQSQGNSWRPLVHVEDVARAIRIFVESGETGVYNIVAENWQIAELAEEVAACVGVPHRPSPDVIDRRNYRASSVKASEFWTPQRFIENEALDELHTNTLLLPEGNYIRLDSLKRLRNLGVLDAQLRRAA